MLEAKRWLQRLSARSKAVVGERPFTGGRQGSLAEVRAGSGSNLKSASASKMSNLLESEAAVSRTLAAGR